MPAKIDLIGKRFGRLVVIGEKSERDKRGHVLWECLCDCGNKCVVLGYSLGSGKTNSCGCLNIERLTKHGMHESIEYKVWENMKQRCTNKKAHAYEHYGGRGIYVCERWRDFKNFFEDMGKRPNKSFSIERRNNSDGYCPENCYWTTQTTQTRNTRISKNNSTGFKGVSLDKRSGRYLARISTERKQITLGQFDSIAEAAEARRLGEIKYWGKNYA